MYLVFAVQFGPPIVKNSVSLKSHHVYVHMDILGVLVDQVVLVMLFTGLWRKKCI